MGYVYAINPFVGKFVYEVHEPAGVHKKAIMTHGVERCSDTGDQLGYHANWEPDGLFHVYATEAEAERKMNEDSARKREEAIRRAAWSKERRAFGKRVHFHVDRDQFTERKWFLEARKRGDALCEYRLYSGSRTITKNNRQVTCQNCLRIMRHEAGQ